MRPLDPVLIRQSGSVRSAVLGALLAGGVAALAAVVQAAAAAAVIAGAFLEQRGLAATAPALGWFVAAWITRSLAVTGQDLWARRCGLRAVAGLRRDLAMASAAGGASTSLALLGRGVDALEVYVARYLPQLVLAVLVPIALGAWVLRNDPVSAIVLLITVPLIPVFMALIGWFTEDAVTRQWKAVARITDVIDDLFAGLPDLVIFDRAKRQADLVRQLGGSAATATMKVLRISFLSSFALELIATISVAVIALGIGLRLVNGEINLETGLMILILAPEVYLPIRQVGTQFHAAVDGLAAWEEARPFLVQPARVGAPLPAVSAVLLRDLQVGHDFALHTALSCRITRGDVVAVVGPSGAGKSTLLRTLAGLQAPVAGSILIEDGQEQRSLTESASASWFGHLAYLPQDPWLGHGTVREALTRGTTASDADCRAALDSLHLQDITLETRIDDLGGGVSVGQRRRIALARASLRQSDVILLDEPTAAIDAASEAAVLECIESWRRSGAIVIVVAHRPALVQAAGQVIRVEPPS